LGSLLTCLETYLLLFLLFPREKTWEASTLYRLCG
jgi:hypothetical protein